MGETVTSVPIFKKGIWTRGRKAQREEDMQTPGEKMTMSLGWCSYNPGVPWLPGLACQQTPETAVGREGAPRAISKSMTLIIPQFSDFQSVEYETVNGCCLKSPDFWYFVRQFLANIDVKSFSSQ